MMRFWRRLSIRWRITIGSVLVAAVLIGAAGELFLAQVRQAQLNSDKKILYGATTPYLAQIRNHPDQIDDPSGEERLVILDPDEQPVATNLPDPLRDRLEEIRDLGSGSHLQTIGGRSYLIVVRVVFSAGGEWHIIAARDQSATTDVVLRNLANILLIGGGALLLGFGLSAWLLTTVALRPVASMRRRAETLDAVGTDELLPIGPARDEVAALGETLNRLLARVRAATAREHQMVADASHELRTPLTVLRAQLELAQRDTDPERRQADLDDAARSAERLSRLAENLLVLSRLEAERQPTTASWSDLVREYLDSSDRMRAVAGAGIRIEFSVDEPDGDEPFRIEVDSFGRLVDNLVGNAVKAIGAGGGNAVEVALAKTPDGLRLEVADDGPGMPEDFVPLAFDRFTTPESSRTPDSGAGLGLAIVRTIVRRAGGRVTLSNASPGLAVVVELPSRGSEGGSPALS